MQTNLINVFLLALIMNPAISLAQDSNYNKRDNQGKRQGTWEKTYPETGNIRYTGQFEHGREVGTFKFFTKDNPDHPKATKTYSRNKKTVEIKYFDNHGHLKSKGQLKNRKRLGKWTYYFSKGDAVMMTEEYKNDQLHGWKKVFFKNGKLTKKQHFKNGKKDGREEIYNKNGTLVEMYTYRNGKRQGPSKLFDNSGQVTESGRYKNGRRHGKWKYYKDGASQKTKTFPLENPAGERKTGEPEGYKDGGKPDMSDVRKDMN